MRSTSLLLLALVVSACGSPEQSPSDGGADANPQTQPDADFVDAATDAGIDAAMNDGGQDAGARAPRLYRPVASDDALLANAALWILGSHDVGAEGSCSSCHGLTRERLRDWERLTKLTLSEDGCLADLELETPEVARRAIECVRAEGADDRFVPRNLGVFAAATPNAFFRFAFDRAHGPTDGPAQYDAFLSLVEMPPRESLDPPRIHTLSQTDLDIVVAWMLRGLPKLEELVGPGSGPTGCDPFVSAEVSAHTSALSTTGWHVRNREAGMLMFGCAGAADALGCLSSFPATSQNSATAGWDRVPGSTSRLLFTTPSPSSYWTRSSPDGRFVAHGASGGSRVIDLRDGRIIGVTGAYDPGFFPDGSGFMMLGGGGVCAISALTTGVPTFIDFSGPGCTTQEPVGLYEHLGASLGGGDYWGVFGEFVSDSGGSFTTLGNPAASFSSGSTATIQRMQNTGAGFVREDSLAVPTPNEGDAVISPSSTLIMTRFGNGTQLGYTLRRVDATRIGGTWSVDAPFVARYCVQGGKPAFSLDERWAVYHRYVSPTDTDAQELGFSGAADPGFANYASRGASNLYAIELATGATVRLTEMHPGQYALYPHFRSDGWLYFLVRSSRSQAEMVVASDALLRLAAE
jgi:hypothetical protein